MIEPLRTLLEGVGRHTPLGDFLRRRKQIRDEALRYAQEDRTFREKYRSLVISFPKSGRTWHRVLIGNYLVRQLGEDPSASMNLDRLCRKASLPAIGYSHNGANFLDATPATSAVVASPSLWEGRTVLLLVREPKDVLTSSFFHARYRSKAFSGSISEFIRSPSTGIDKILTAYNRWDRERHRAAAFTVISYEAMHERAEEMLAASLRALGVENPDPLLIAQAVEFAEIDKMRDYQDSNFFKSERLNNAGPDRRAAKVREGIVGGFRQHMSAEDIRYIEQRIGRLGNPFEALHVPTSPGETE